MFLRSHRAATRYAKAFFQMAQEANKLEKIYQDTQLILSVIHHSKVFASALNDPTIPSHKMQAILEEAFKSHVDHLTLKFLSALCQRKRINCLMSFCSLFQKLYFDFKKILHVKLTSFVHLSHFQLESLKEKLERHYKKIVEVTQETDHSLLGGFKVQIDDLIYDYSIKTQLNRFHETVLNA